MRPPKGEAWDTLADRGADAFVDLCQNYADVTPTRRSRPLVVVHTSGTSAEVDGIPIATETVNQVMTEARVIEQHDDAPAIDDGNERPIGDPDRPDGLRLINVGTNARAGPAP